MSIDLARAHTAWGFGCARPLQEHRLLGEQVPLAGRCGNGLTQQRRLAIATASWHRPHLHTED
eukprot:3659993-Prorocentrum_lima.AAC.1